MSRPAKGVDKPFEFHSQVSVVDVSALNMVQGMLAYLGSFEGAASLTPFDDTKVELIVRIV